MWSTSARGFQRARQTPVSDLDAPVPSANTRTAANTSQQRGSRAAGTAPPQPPLAKARGHPAPPAAGRPARGASHSPGKLQKNGGDSTKQLERPAAPTQQSLKQAAAQARTERLRSALQQLRAGRCAAHRAAATGSCGGEAAVQTVDGDAAAAPSAVHHPPPSQAAAAASLAASTARPSSGHEPDLDSDVEDLFDDVSLDLLARLQLGGQRSMQPAASVQLPSGTPCRQPLEPQPAAAADVLAAARRALHEAAAEPEMPVRQRSCGAATRLTTAAPTQSGFPHSAAAMQHQLAQLRYSLAGTPSLLSPTLSGQAGGGASRPAAVSPGGERRAELVLTRPPCRQAAVLHPASPAAPPSSHAAASRTLAATLPSSPYCIGGATPATRLASLLLLPEGRPPAPPVACSDPASPQLIRANVPPALLRPGWQDGQCTSSRQLAAAQPAPATLGGMLSLGVYKPTSHATAGPIPAQGTCSPIDPARALPQRDAFAACSSGSGSGSGSSWPGERRAFLSGQAGDILAEWRARRLQQAHEGTRPAQQQQSSSLADRYSRFLSLRQPEPAAAPTPWVAAAAGGRRLGAEALGLGGRLNRPPAVSDATTSSSSNRNGGGMLCSLQPAGPEGGDILARWRARRRQQAQAGGGSAEQDLTPLLTLRAPGTQGAVPLSQLPAAAEHPPAATSSRAQQPAAGSEPETPAEGGRNGRVVCQATLAAPSMLAAIVRPSSSMEPALAHPRWLPLPILQPAGADAGPPTVLHSVSSAIAEQPAATSALAEQPAATSTLAVPEQQLWRAGSSAAERAVEPCQTVPSSQSAAELPPVCTTAPTVEEESGVALALPAAPASDGITPATAACQQPSRPASAASSGRATPLSSLALTSCGSAAWSPGISRLLDDCIGGYFAGGSSLYELAGEAAGGAECSGDEAEGCTAAAAGASSGGSGLGAVAGSCVPAKACPDPADLPFLSAAASPAAGCEKRPPPAGGVVATARALLAEAVVLLDQPTAGRVPMATASGAAAAGQVAAEQVAEPATPTVGTAAG